MTAINLIRPCGDKYISMLKRVPAVIYLNGTAYSDKRTLVTAVRDVLPNRNVI